MREPKAFSDAGVEIGDVLDTRPRDGRAPKLGGEQFMSEPPIDARGLNNVE